MVVIKNNQFKTFDSLCIKEYIGDNEVVRISYRVAEISENDFYQCSHVKKIIIPNSVRIIVRG